MDALAFRKQSDAQTYISTKEMSMVPNVEDIVYVTWDGMRYDLEVTIVKEMNKSDIYYVGNGSLLGYDSGDVDCPFVIYWLEDRTDLEFITTETRSSHEIGINL